MNGHGSISVESGQLKFLLVPPLKIQRLAQDELPNFRLQ